ncbi:MAG: hypothetical protein ABSE73_16805 [Planctomycetota bacterium]
MDAQDTEHPDLSAGVEGVSTLTAQFSRRVLERIVRTIQRERARGVPDDKIARAMERDLSGYDEHSRRLLLRLASGGLLSDDFPPETVAGSEQLKSNTLLLTLTAAPSGIKTHSIVHYQGREWLVAACEKNCCKLKLVQ